MTFFDEINSNSLWFEITWMQNRIFFLVSFKNKISSFRSEYSNTQYYFIINLSFMFFKYLLSHCLDKRGVLEQIDILILIVCYRNAKSKNTDEQC